MRAIVAPSVEAVVEVVERTEPAAEAATDAPRRGPVETEGDKIRRQQLLRRKTTLARRALAAHRTR